MCTPGKTVLLIFAAPLAIFVAGALFPLVAAAAIVMLVMKSSSEN